MKRNLLLILILFVSQINSKSIAKAKEKVFKVDWPGLSGSIPLDLHFSISKFFNSNIKGNQEFQNRIILHGPSGNGKTAFVDALGEVMKINTEIVRLNATELAAINSQFAMHRIERTFDSAIVDAGKIVPGYEVAQIRKKIIIFLDKIEAIESEHDSEYNLKLHQLLLTWLEKIKNNDYIFVVFETQNLNKLNKDFIYKFKSHNIIEFSNPDKEMREEIIQFYLDKFEMKNFIKEQIDKIVKNTEGFSIGQIELLLQEINDEAIRKSITKKIKFEDILELVKKYKNLDSKKEKNNNQQEEKKEKDKNLKDAKAYIIRDPEDTQTLDEVIPEEIRSIITDLKSKENLDYLPSKMIFYGPPGNGKSMLAEKMAYAAGAKFCFVDSASLLTTYQGSASVGINNIFNECLEIAKKQPVFIFFDETDQLVNNKKNKNDDKESATTTLWLKISNYLKNNKNIKVIFATNNLEVFHKTLMNRFEKITEVFEIPNPNFEQRKELFSHFIIKNNAEIKDKLVPAYAALVSEGLSIRNIELIVKGLINEARRKKKKEISVKELTSFIDKNQIGYTKQLKEWYKENRENITNLCTVINTILYIINFGKKLKNSNSNDSNQEIVPNELPKASSAIS